MHRRKGTTQYGEVEADGRRPLLEDANSSDDEDDRVDGLVSGVKTAPISFSRLEADAGIDDSQWTRERNRTPWRTICFATVLFVAGSGCLVLAVMIGLGSMHTTFDDRMWPAALLGFLMFIPGAFYIGLTVFAWLGLFGCTYDQIPQFNT